MKVSIESLLGSASRINNQRNIDNRSEKKESGKLSADHLEINTKIDSRLDSVARDIKEVQSSISRNQVVRNGILLVEEDYGKGGENLNQIFEDVKFNDRKVLADFIKQDELSTDYIQERKLTNENLLKEDVMKLNKLQVETENILASNLASDEKAAGAMKSLESSLKDVNVNSITNLNPDAVMRLIG